GLAEAGVPRGPRPPGSSDEWRRPRVPDGRPAGDAGRTSSVTGWRTADHLHNRRGFRGCAQGCRSHVRSFPPALVLDGPARLATLTDLDFHTWRRTTGPPGAHLRALATPRRTCAKPTGRSDKRYSPDSNRPLPGPLS